MRDLDLKTLRLFVTVCECLNIQQAARHAHIEASAISKRIAQLEGSLGTVLLARGRRGVQPTPAGLALLEHARTMLFTADRLEADVAAYAGGLRGHVRLVASASAIAESLLDDIAAFMRDPDNAGIRIDIEEGFSSDVTRRVREGSASIGICWDNADLSGLRTHGYRTDRLALAVHPEHPLAGHSAVRFDQTLDHPHVILPPASAVSRWLHRDAAQAGRTLHCRVVVSNFDSALRVVQAGLGVAVIPGQVCQPMVERGRIVTLRLLDQWAPRRFVACFRDIAQLTPAASRLLEDLCGRARADETGAF